MIDIGVVDRGGTLEPVAQDTAAQIEGARVVSFGRPVDLGPDAPRADVLLLGPAELTAAGLRRERAWRAAHPASVTIAVVPPAWIGATSAQELRARGFHVVRGPLTVAKAARALETVLDELALLAREVSRWDAPDDRNGAVAEAPLTVVELEPVEHPFSPASRGGIEPAAGPASRDGQTRMAVQLDVQTEALPESPASGAAPAPPSLEHPQTEGVVTRWGRAVPLEGGTVPRADAEPMLEQEAERDAAPELAARTVEDEPALRPVGACVITIASATGGCGKTFYATNLAAALASAGHRALLVDLDLQFGEVAVGLRVQHPYSIYDGLYDSRGRPLPEEAFAAQLGELVAHHALGFNVIVAPKTPELADYVGAADAARVLRAVSPLYDFVIVDTPPSLNEVVLTALDASSIVAVMATPDVPSLKNLRVFLDTLQRLRMGDGAVRLVLNKVEKDIGIEVAQIQEAFSHRFVGVIPQSTVVSRAINAGTVAIDMAPHSPVSRRLRESMAAVLPEGTLSPALPAAESEPPAAQGRFRRILAPFTWRAHQPEEVGNEAV